MSSMPQQMREKKIKGAKQKNGIENISLAKKSTRKLKIQNQNLKS